MIKNDLNLLAISAKLLLLSSEDIEYVAKQLDNIKNIINIQ